MQGAGKKVLTLPACVNPLLRPLPEKGQKLFVNAVGLELGALPMLYPVARGKAKCEAKPDQDMQDLSNFIDALEGPFAMVDAHGCIYSHNALFAAHCARDDASLVGQQIQDFWEPSQQRDALTDFLGQLGSVPEDSELETLTGASMVAKPVFVDGRWSILCQGTSARIEDPLLHFFLEHVDQGFWDYDAHKNKFLVSDAWREMRGFDLAEEFNALDRDWLEDVHPCDRAELKALFEGQMRGETQSFTIQYRRKHLKTGEWIWLHCRATVVEQDANGVPIRMVGTDTDITEIKNDETRITQLDNKIDLAIGVAGIGVFEFDHSTSRVFWDDRLLAIYGLPPGENEKSKEDWAKFIHPDDADATVAYSEHCEKTHSDVKCDFRIIRPNGEVRHLRTMARYVDTTGGGKKLIGVNIDVTEDVLRTQELEDARKRLEFDSRHDALTGLANRRLLDETIAEFSPDEDFCMMHLDLDFFKEVNDTIGHAAGDAVLVHVASSLSRLMDDARLICRYGGDEFAVLYAPAPSNDRIKELADSVIAAFQHPYIFEGQACAFGVSIGSAKGRDKDTVFKQTDIALYAAKNAGRGRHHAYTDRDGAQAVGQVRRRQDLVDAISENKIECWYQPQYDARTNQFVSAEALARLRMDGDVRSPDGFLPLAEKTGLLADIEEFIFQRVLADQTQWAQAGLVYPSISVNISQNRLVEQTLARRLTKDIQDHHLLSLEILETAFLDDPDAPAIKTIEALRSMGFTIELDDFGTGHASVVSLLTVRPDKIKIDQRLTRDIAHSKPAEDILRAVVNIARTQGVGVILEGIESDDQLEALKGIDCDVLQGYALSPPLSASDFALMLQESGRQRAGAF